MLPLKRTLCLNFNQCQLTLSLVGNPTKWLGIDFFHLKAKAFQPLGLYFQGKENHQGEDYYNVEHGNGDKEVHVGKTHTLEDVQVD